MKNQEVIFGKFFMRSNICGSKNITMEKGHSYILINMKLLGIKLAYLLLFFLIIMEEKSSKILHVQNNYNCIQINNTKTNN